MICWISARGCAFGSVCFPRGPLITEVGLALSFSASTAQRKKLRSAWRRLALVAGFASAQCRSQKLPHPLRTDRRLEVP